MFINDVSIPEQLNAVMLLKAECWEGEAPAELLAIAKTARQEPHPPNK